MIDANKTAIKVKIVKRWPILNHPRINNGIFNTKYITDVANVNGKYRSDTDCKIWAKPVIPEA